MLALRLPAKLERRLERLAKKTGRTKAFYAREAIQEHIAEIEDYYLAMDRLEKKLRGVPLDEVVRKLGLDR
jgi:RHH-type transcriptional regulator, rel operon repressor / antitoxin RelB